MNDPTRNFKAQNFGQMKITVLERELAEKTRILEKTSAILADSQRQYRNLLSEFEKLKSTQNYQYKERNSYFNSNHIFTNETDYIKESALEQQHDFENNGTYNQPLQQLNDFEGTIQKLNSQMNRLKAQNFVLLNEQKEWNNFSLNLMKNLKDGYNIEFNFPENDGEAQRFILNDVVKKISSNQNLLRHENQILKSKYSSAKSKLSEVQKKCDRMLMILDQKGISIPNKKWDCERNENIDYVNSLKNHVKQLSGVTKQMKSQYYENYKNE